MCIYNKNVFKFDKFKNQLLQTPSIFQFHKKVSVSKKPQKTRKWHAPNETFMLLLFWEKKRRKISLKLTQIPKYICSCIVHKRLISAGVTTTFASLFSFKYHFGYNPIIHAKTNHFYPLEHLLHAMDTRNIS